MGNAHIFCAVLPGTGDGQATGNLVSSDILYSTINRYDPQIPRFA